MAALPLTEHHSHLCADKTSTRFKWSLGDWKLLRDYYLRTKVTSPEFELNNGLKCKLMLAGPDVPRFPRTGHIFVLMSENVYSIPILAAMVSLSYIDQDIKKLLTTDQRQGNGIPKTVTIILSHDDFISHYLREDTLTVLCEIVTVTGIKEVSDIGKANFSTDISKGFKEMYSSKELCDFTIIVGKKKLYAHKVILATHSDVFKAMFTTKMEEEKEGVVRIEDAKFAVFDALLEYMYTGRVNETEDIVKDLLCVADKYQVAGLKNLCKDILSSSNSKKNKAIKDM